MTEATWGVDRRFTISRAEIDRRRAAFDRLGVATLVAATLATGDLILRGWPLSLTAVVALSALFALARAALGRTLERFSRTAWTLSLGGLRRSDPRSEAVYPLASVRGVRTKRTTSGAIREMRIELDGDAPLYVNAVEDLESLRSALLDLSPAPRQTEVREVVDFDAPWFYVAFGIALGAVIAVAARLALAAPRIDVGMVYGACAVYALGLGAYWLRAKPLAGRFGRASGLTDRVVGVVIVCLGVLAAIFAFTRT